MDKTELPWEEPVFMSNILWKGQNIRERDPGSEGGLISRVSTSMSLSALDVQGRPNLIESFGGRMK